MLDWNQNDVARMLGVQSTSQPQEAIVRFPLQVLGRPAELVVCPFEEYAQVFVQGQSVSAFIGCRRIRVEDEAPEGGDQCIVFEGQDGHAVITRSDEGHQLFFRIGKAAD